MDVAAQRALLEQLARAIVARKLAAPAIFVLEAFRPLNFITAEFLVFLQPFARLVVPRDKYDLLVEALHDRANVTWLIDRIEQLDADPGALEAEPQAAATENPHSGGSHDGPASGKPQT